MEELQIFKLLTRKYCSDDIIKGGYWYEFEKMMNSMVKNWFHQLETLNWPEFDYENEKGEAMRQLYQNVETDINIFPLVVRQIERALIQYLEDETQGNRDFRLTSISNEFAKQSLALSFNYTDVAERYSQDIFYIHGSLKEKHIVFGYPPDSSMPCVIPDEVTLMDKARLRDRLGFFRHVTTRASYPDINNLEEIIEGYDIYLDSFYSPDGEYRELEQLPLITQDWITQYRNEQPYSLQGRDNGSIKTMIIIGHSVHSDVDIFDQLLDIFTGITNITIYTYKGEDDGHLSEKKEFFTKRGLPVIFKFYE